jgi:uncharacterized protein YndB with AHSA1/START domain
MEIRREVDLTGTIDDVWPVLSGTDGLEKWLEGSLDVDGDTVTTGATGTFTEPDGTIRHMLIDDVDEGRSVTWTWWTDDVDEPPSSVSIVIEPIDDVVRVVVVERQLRVVDAAIPRALAMAG